jgi:putative hemolysin
LSLSGFSNAWALANPAAVLCQKQGLEYRIIKNPHGGEIGICIFKDAKHGDSYCEEWAYFRQQCKPGQHKWPSSKIGSES